MLVQLNLSIKVTKILYYWPLLLDLFRFFFSFFGFEDPGNLITGLSGRGAPD